MKTTPRSPDRLRHHYEVEKALADRLRRTTSREERARLYDSMYDTLFAAVPDHPRLTNARDPAFVAHINRGRMAIVRPYLRGDTRALDIGAGDCSFSFALARHARSVTAIDISEGSAVLEGAPQNFRYLVYDGFNLPLEPGSIDLAFSDQLVEHLHVDDADWHFSMIAKVLAPGGHYVFRTPHRYTGPHDISQYFTKGDPEGFHMKEWTYGELRTVLRRAGYGKLTAIWSARAIALPLPLWIMVVKEKVLGLWPRVLRRRIARLPFPYLTIAARKA
ncbi:MAG TPA: class I SAM-dependent methyltransferase [Candidatus Krumholzibacteria bacterium]|nr:class I SAM-dependent methyltransferase [Candidatus Krumholzibacteria bacterium]